MNIIVDSNIVLLKDILEKDFKVIPFDAGELTSEFIRQSNSEILFVRSTTNCDVFLLGNTKVKFIGTATAGVDNLDLEFFDKNGIKWTNASGSNSISVAEYVTYCIQKWCLENLKEISNITLGVVGFGNIGSKVGKIFEKYCSKILVYDPYIAEIKNSIAELTDYETLLSQSDIITFHTPLVKGGEHPTYKMLDINSMEIINKDALLINASRGSVVDEYALKFTNFNPINIVLDVWESEPDIDSELAEKVFISTPHIAGHSYEGKLRGTLNMIQGLELYLGKRIDKNLIIDEINKNPKVDLNSIDYDGLYELLETNIQVERTCFEFKKLMNDFDYLDFNEMRKEYPKHYETLTDTSFQ